MDAFLDDGIRWCNKEKKLLCESAKNQIQTVTSVNLKLSRDRKTVTNGNDQDLKLSLGISNDISALTTIEGVDIKVTQDNLSYDMKMIHLYR